VTTEEQRTELERLGEEAVDVFFDTEPELCTLSLGITRAVLDAVLPAARAQWEQEWEQVGWRCPECNDVWGRSGRRRDTLCEIQIAPPFMPVFVRRVEGP